MKTGIFSVTFRPKSREEIVLLTKEAELDSVLWGGDIHVPHGELALAKETFALCQSHGIGTDVYGSYYKISPDGISTVLDTADALGTKTVRIWAGTKGSADTSEDERRALTEQLRADADTALSRGFTLAFEYHGGTLTDNAESALRMLREADRENIRLHWQPNQYRDFEFNKTACRLVAPYVDAVHVFAWVGNGKFPLHTQQYEWQTYFDILGEHGSCSLAVLEFLPVESREDLLRDTETLRRIIL